MISAPDHSLLINEDDVVRGVADYLAREGWHIDQELTSKQRGIDVIARRGEERLLVEAKGSIACKPDAVPFNRNKSIHSVNAAIGTCCRLMTANTGAICAIAYPMTDFYRKAIEDCWTGLARLDIRTIPVRRNLDTGLVEVV